MKNVSHGWRFYSLFWCRWDSLKKYHFWISNLEKTFLSTLQTFLKDNQFNDADSSITNGWVLLPFSLQGKMRLILGFWEIWNILTFFLRSLCDVAWDKPSLLLYSFQYLVLTQKHVERIIRSLKWISLGLWKLRKTTGFWYENLRILFTTLIFFLYSSSTNTSENSSFFFLRGYIKKKIIK